MNIYSTAFLLQGGFKFFHIILPLTDIFTLTGGYYSLSMLTTSS